MLIEPNRDRKKIEEQINLVIEKTVFLIEDTVVGIYLHGSFAMGCFNPNMSDIDLLIVTQRQLLTEEKKNLINMLVEMSIKPSPIEATFVSLNQLTPWQHPCPFDLYYSERKRFDYISQIEDGSWQKWNDEVKKDYFLASYITSCKHKGICLWGETSENILPEVPVEDYADSMLHNFDDSASAANTNPVYYILNACRIMAFLSVGMVCSKVEAADWAISRIPLKLRPILIKALDFYTGKTGRPHFSYDEIYEYSTYFQDLFEEYKNQL
ncbi:MAG: aminoglycoside adenylyltransferase domain-containing protein [Bacteroidales bacterium]